jgi:hypothetical protein
MALKRPYRMHRRGTLQRAPGLTPIDSPAGAEPSSFDPDELTGKLGVQQEEEQEEEVEGTHIGGGRSDKSPGQPQSRPARSRAAETPDPEASGASPAGRGSRRP